MHQPVTVSSNTCSQTHVQLCKAFSSTSTRFNLTGIKYISDSYTPAKVGINLVDALAKALFVHTFD